MLEGFEPDTVAKEVITKNFLKIFDIVEKDYTGSIQRFSSTSVQAIKQTFGECSYEIS